MLAWAGPAEAERTEALAEESLAANDAAPSTDRAFGDRAGTRCALATARLNRGEVDGAVEALAPVLALPPGQRIHGIVTSGGHVRQTLAAVDGGQVGGELTDRLQAFTTDRLVITQ